MKKKRKKETTKQIKKQISRYFVAYGSFGEETVGDFYLHTLQET